MKKTLLLAGLLAGLASWPTSAQSVSPVYKVYPADTKVATALLHNTLDKTARFTVEVKHIYLGADGQIVREPATDVEFAPLVVTLGPDKKQVILVKRTANVGGPERFYGVYITQLPDSKKYQEVFQAKMAWVFRNDAAKPRLSAWWDKNELVIKNEGDASAMLSSFVVGDRTKEDMKWVLIGQTTRIPFDGARTATMSVNVNGKTETLSVGSGQ